VKSPVRSSRKPASAGDTTPPKFPKPFCIPIHLPADSGPARV
jgi:hypothetical protein